MASRLFIVTYPYRGPSDIAGVRQSMDMRETNEAFVKAEDIPDAFHRFATTNPNNGQPTCVREAGPVAQNVLRKLMDKRSILS